MGHGRRMSRKLYRRAQALLDERDGRKCLRCGWRPGAEPSDFQVEQGFIPPYLQELQIDHIDGNPRHNPEDGSNWRYLCKTCNIWVWVKAQQNGGVGCECVCVNSDADEDEDVDARVHTERQQAESLDEGSYSNLLKKIVDYSEGETSIQINARGEPRYRQYCIRLVLKLGQVLWKELNPAGAEEAGISEVTGERYLRKLVSRKGVLKEYIDEEKRRWVVMKPEDELREAMDE